MIPHDAMHEQVLHASPYFAAQHRAATCPRSSPRQSLGQVLAASGKVAMQHAAQTAALPAQEARRFGKPYNLRVAAALGGMNKHEQFKDLKAGSEIAVCTPGRMIDLLKMKACSLQRTTFLVFDEADRMFDLGFEPQARPELCTHMECCLLCTLLARRSGLSSRRGRVAAWRPATCTMPTHGEARRLLDMALRAAWSSHCMHRRWCAWQALQSKARQLCCWTAAMASWPPSPRGSWVQLPGHRSLVKIVAISPWLQPSWSPAFSVWQYRLSACLHQACLAARSCSLLSGSP